MDSAGSVLLIKRGTPPAEGKWSVPGGLVGVGEELEEALIREIREECRIEVNVGPLLEVSSRIIRRKDGRIWFHYVLLDYVCKMTGGTPQAGTDAKDVRWFTLEELESLDTTEGIQHLVRKGVSLESKT